MIRVTDLTYEYVGHDDRRDLALTGVGLEIHEGECVAIMGANGSGKTTLARCLNGLYLPTSGSVEIDDLDTRDPQARREIRRRVGFLFQNPENQIVAATVEGEIAFGLENLGLARAEMRRRVDRMLSLFDLERYRQQPPHLLSGGEMQRLAIAAVMAMEPNYLILDEPTSLLDPSSRNRLLALVAGVDGGIPSASGTGAITTVLITQFPAEALIADRLLVLHRGRIIHDEPPDKLFQRAAALHEIGLTSPIDYELYAYLRDRLGVHIPLKDLVLPPIL
jgi:energy-coupling factor transport system ATP-binding protein